MDTTIAKEYKLAGYTVRLFANRIEIEQKAFLATNRDTILLRSVTDVACGLGKRLTITTQDGKRRVLNIGGQAAEEWRQAILAAIP